MVQLCGRCNSQKAALRRPKTFVQLCQECFFQVFEDEVHQTIVTNKLFKPGEKVAIGASGGKDSTVLAHLLTLLNKRHNYGLNLFLLSIDEGITGYRDDSLETVKRNEQQYQIPLEVVSYKQLYGWTMDEIVKEIGTKNNCTFCGVFRRQALDRGAFMMKADKIATGHNADDIAETVLLNILRGDLPRLSRCASIITGEDGELPRVKPFKYTYQKEIVMYAYFKRLDYFSTECIYAPFAARGLARDFVKDLEAARPRAIVDLIHSAENFRIDLGSEGVLPQPKKCERCGYICSQSVCKACQLLEGLNKGLPSMGISRPQQVKSRTASKAAAEKLRSHVTAANAPLGDGQKATRESDHTAAEDIDADSHACGKDVCQCPRVSGKGSQRFQHSAPVSLQHDGKGSAGDCQTGNDQVQEVYGGTLMQAACDAVCDCATQSQSTGCASSEDWSMPSNFTDANDARESPAASLEHHARKGSLGSALTDIHADSQIRLPLRVHGKLYESNLRAVEAHPSARRPVPADFGTSW